MNVIKIYPEWNVNAIINDTQTFTKAIKIYPEWNVNLHHFIIKFENIFIKIYPEWNVNGSTNIKIKFFSN